MLPSLRKQDEKKFKVKTGKINKLLSNILTDNITELNELIHLGAKLAGDKIGAPLRNANRNIKPA